MSAVTDFKSIRQILDRKEQKAEFEEKNPPKVEQTMYWPYGVAVPFCDGVRDNPSAGIASNYVWEIDRYVVKMK